MARYYSNILLYTCLVLTITGRTAAEPKVHIVNVGKAGNYVFNPNTTFADPDDVIVFRLFPTNHSVVRGVYTGSDDCGPEGCNPCVPYEAIYPGQEGFNSGNFLTQVVLDDNVPTFNITIEGTSPIWVYCAATNSCHPNGMVAAINPAKGTSIKEQEDAARNAAFQLSPGQPWPAEGTTPSSQSTTALLSAQAEGHGMKDGTIAGIAVGIILIVFLIGGLVYYMWRWRRRKGTKTATLEPEEDPIPQSIPVRPLRPSAASLWSPNTPNTSQLANSPPPISPLTEYVNTAYSPSSYYDKPVGHPAFRHPAFGRMPGQPTTLELEGDEPIMEMRVID